MYPSLPLALNCTSYVSIPKRNVYFYIFLIIANFACLFIHTLQTKGTTNHSAMPCYETNY